MSDKLLARASREAERRKAIESHPLQRDVQPEVTDEWLPFIGLPPHTITHIGGALREQALLHLQHTVGNHAIQRTVDRSRSTSIATDDLAQRIRAASISGSPLDAVVRDRLEAGLNADLSSVQIHTDDEADRLSRSVHALAFTTGQHIFFRQSMYQPRTEWGAWLLAHEAAHTIQQSSGTSSVRSRRKVSQPDDATEREAEAAADRVLGGQRSQVNISSNAHVARGAWDMMTNVMSSTWNAAKNPNAEQAGTEDQSWLKGLQSMVRGLVGWTMPSAETFPVNAALNAMPRMPGETLGTPTGELGRLTPAEIDTFTQSIESGGAQSGTYFELPGQNPKTGGGLQAMPEPKINPNPNQIAYHVHHYVSDVGEVRTANPADVPIGGALEPGASVIPENVGQIAEQVPSTSLTNKVTNTGVSNAAELPIGGSNVEVRYHSSNPRFPEHGPTVQVNTPSDKFGFLGDTDIAVGGQQNRSLLPEGSWKSFGEMDEAEKAAMHWPTGQSVPESAPAVASAEEAAELTRGKGGGGSVLNKIFSAANYGLQFAGNLMSGQDVGESAFGAAAGGFVGNRVSGGPWDIAINLANAGLTLGGAPQEVTGFTQLAADATPSGFTSSLASNIGRGLWNLGEGIVSGDWSGLKQQGQDIVQGKAGTPLQGYGMAIDALTGGNMNYAVDRKAKTGERGIATALGNYIGDKWFPLINRKGGIGSTLGEIGGYLWEGARGQGGIKSALNWVGDTASSAWDWTKGAISDVGSAIGQTAATALDWMTSLF